jgi:hypothetical protein
MKDTKENQILIRQYNENAKKESHRKGGRKSLQNKGSQDSQCQVYNARKDSCHQQSLAATRRLVIQANNCSM